MPSLLILVIALGLYVYRVVVQEKQTLRLRLPSPTMPEEEAAVGATPSRLITIAQGGPALPGRAPLLVVSCAGQPPLVEAPASARSCSASSRFWSAVIFLNSFWSARRLITWFQ